MSGISNAKLLQALGYDDDYRSTELTRHLGWATANSSEWAEGRYVVPRTNILVVRPPNSLTEFDAVHITDLLFNKVFDVNYRS